MIGDAAAQQQHARAMIDGTVHGATGVTDPPPGAGHGRGAEAPAVEVDPGETGTLSFSFTTAGTFEIACHQPGHYETGMRATVAVG